ncbi:MAG: lysylphosphatidylglycerol synthase domain-containing protein [Pseudomonadota bacterium]|nr:lysylphosphatidylglycerol synthase domain-containing protein [Pseudomonadota bacterium]
MTPNSPSASSGKRYSLKWRLLLSITFSFLILFSLWLLVSSAGTMKDSASFTETFRNITWGLVILYIIISILGTWIRALRYRTLLKADGLVRVPGIGFMFLVTLSRNMFVDMVPARMGEASYVIMLNSAYSVPVAACLSTLFISVVLDILALAILLIFLVLLSLIASSESGITVYNALVATSLIVVAAGFMVFAAVPLSKWFSRMMNATGLRILKRFGQFIIDVGASIRRVQMRELLSLTLSQSLALRVIKYGGLYSLYLAVTTVNFPEFAALPLWKVIPAFVSAEAAASLPLPTFMSFGSYEGGGMLAFSVLGFAAAEILLLMFVIHLLSQVVDYTLGGIGLLGFFLTTNKKEAEVTNE